MYQGYSKGQQDKAARIIDEALRRNFVVSVGDGEGGFELKRSSDRNAIVSAVGNMDADELVFDTPEGRRVGWLMLVWGNAKDGSELASDWTVSDAMEAIANA